MLKITQQTIQLVQYELVDLRNSEGWIRHPLHHRCMLESWQLQRTVRASTSTSNDTHSVTYTRTPTLRGWDIRTLTRSVAAYTYTPSLRYSYTHGHTQLQMEPSYVDRFLAYLEKAMKNPWGKFAFGVAAAIGLIVIFCGKSFKFSSIINYVFPAHSIYLWWFLTGQIKWNKIKPLNSFTNKKPT